MTTFTQLESEAAIRVHSDATELTRWYANDGDRNAATVALLIEALILAGGASFLKPNDDEDRSAATVALLIKALILSGGASFLKPTEGE